MKINKIYIYGLIITLLLEIFVFNFSSVCSVFSKEISTEGKIFLDYSQLGPVIRITDLDEEIKNIYFDVNLAENAPVNYDIALTDEGNYYDYYFPTGTLYSKTKSSLYRNVHTYGNAHTVSITFSDGGSGFGLENFSVNAIRLNVKRPVFFNILRVIIVYLLFVFFYSLRQGGTLLYVPFAIHEKSKRGRCQLVITICTALAVIALGFFWSGSHKLFDEASKPHHQQYKELAAALLAGDVSLPLEPSEGLITAPNPYDTIYLQANGIDYCADYAYYNGKYYVYFGIVPAVLLYLPYKLITHGDFPNHYAVFVFFMGFVISGFLLYARMVKKYFKGLPFWAYILLSVGTLTCGTFSYLFFTADLYTVPVMAAMCFSFWGLYLWLLGKDLGRKALRYVCYALGSLSMALVAGSRPQFLILSLVAVPLFFRDVFGKNDKNVKERSGIFISLALPYILVAAGVMYYNYARFGSVFDFGATYSLTNNDMNLRGFNVERILISMLTFLFGIPSLNGVFPFWQSAELSYSYLGRMVTEHFLGGIFATNITAVSIFLYSHYQKDIKKKSLGIVFGIFMFSMMITGILDADKAGVLQRYMADMALGAMVCSSIVWACAVERGNRLTFSLLKVLWVAQMTVSFLIICNTASGITLKLYNPELFGKLASLFVF